ncbi:MAG: glutaminyl-peptide cyclotransferase [Deltaproteobacteria bacterium]|nr:glutaminyl-peptide cyclotransferase [Deltaproteobacteria bacterium]
MGRPRNRNLHPTEAGRALVTRPGPLLLVVLFSSWLLLGISGATPTVLSDRGQPPPVFGYQVVHTYPHDPEAYTQGLVFHDGFLFESTGLYGRSSLRQVDLETGRVFRITSLEPRYFGEGLALWEDHWIQLTWQSRVALIYDFPTFRLTNKIPYPREGWGLTHDGRSLIASDGSAQLYFLDPRRLTETKRVAVTEQGRPLAGLNELEYVRGKVLANVYLTDRIACIAPETGEVLGWIDLMGLLPPADRTPRTDVLNGIAYDARRDRLFVTGKNWPKLYEIRLTERPSSRSSQPR